MADPRTFEISCPNCGARLRVKAELAGKRARCPNPVCGKELSVQAPDEAETSSLSFDNPSDRSPSGAPILRHEANEREFQFAVGDSDSIERIVAHVQTHVGEPATVFHEVISDLVHVDVHVVEPTPRRNYYTLVTSGMSDRPMATPTGQEGFQYAELMMCLPSDWPLLGEGCEEPRNSWPVDLLKFLARMPHEYNTWLFASHTVPNGEPPEPLADNTQFCCAVILMPILFGDEFLRLKVDAVKTIHFLSVVPLYREELHYKLSKGFGALIERLGRAGVSELLDIHRKNTCGKRFGIF